MSQLVLSDLDFGGVARCVNHPDPVNPQDVATRAFVLANGGSFSKHQLAVDATIAASTGVTMPRYLQLNSLVTLTVETDATLMVD